MADDDAAGDPYDESSTKIRERRRHARANLTRANLAGADLAGASVRDVTWTGATCPDGTRSDNNGTPASNLGHLTPEVE